MLEAETDAMLAQGLELMAGPVQGALAAERQLSALVARAASLLEQGHVQLMQQLGKFKAEAKQALANNPADLDAKCPSIKCVLDTKAICIAVNEHFHSPVIQVVFLLNNKNEYF